MSRRIALLLAPALGLLLFASGPHVAAEETEGEHLVFRPTYGHALLEARIRNVPVLVSRHKDECGRCKRQHGQVLTQRPFVRWANDHIVVLIAHNELGHEPIVELGDQGLLDGRCPLYPGMTCREHINAAVDVDNARGDDLVQIPFIELCPNTWLVSPNGTVERVAEKDQFEPKKVRAQAEALQEKLGASLDASTGSKILAVLQAAEAAQDDEDYRTTLEKWAAVQTYAAEPPASLRALLEARMATLDEDLGYVIEDWLEAETLDADELREAKALLHALDVTVYGKRLSVHEALARRLR